MKYRSRTDIIAEILNLAKDGTSKNKIICGASLSYAQVKDYMVIVTNNGLLEQRESQYYTTKKGMDYLKHYQTVDTIFHTPDSK